MVRFPPQSVRPLAYSFSLLILLMPSLARADSLYTVVDLQPAGTNYSYVRGIGNGFQGGYIPYGGYTDHAASWKGSASSFQDIHPAFLTDPVWSSASFVLGAGGNQMAGYGWGYSTLGDAALLWTGTPGSCVSLHPSTHVDERSQAWGTDGQQQVGYWRRYITNKTEYHATVWQGTAASVVDLHPAGFISSFATAVSQGQQAGYGNPGAPNFWDHALMWSGSAASVVDLNGTGLNQSYAFGIWGGKVAGNAVGQATSYSTHAMLWNGAPNDRTDLHPAGYDESYAKGICGKIEVGYASGAISGYREHAVAWNSTAGSILDLHALLPSGFTSSRAYAVDEYGNIIGEAGDSQGIHPILWQLNTTPYSVSFQAGQTFADTGLTLLGSSPSALADILADPESGGGHGGVLHLLNSDGGSDVYVGVSKGNLGVSKKIQVEFEYLFATDGKLQVILDGETLDTLDSPGIGQAGYLGSGWAHYSHAFTLAGPSLDSAVQLKVSNVGDPEFYLDNWSVTNLPEPTTSVLLALGELGALLRRRRQ
jgi:hypothetical protein